MSTILNWSVREEEVTREDLVMFVNACFACTGQKEFYSHGYGDRVSIDFLHEYILGNYRLLYARTLAAGINHFNTAQIILKLLATGKDTLPENKAEEGTLIAAALNSLPPQRAWKLLEQLKQRGINNSRSRAIVREYINQHKNINFQAVKYRSKLREIVSHIHLKLNGELGNFLFSGWQKRVYETELFEKFRQAHYSAEAIYELPYTVAEGLAYKHKIPRQIFLSRIESQMTLGEKLRLQKTAERTDKVKIELNWEKLPLTKLALYILSLSIKKRSENWHLFHEGLLKAARNILSKSPLKLGKVAAVLDCSYSSSGSSEKRRRPLGVALAAHYLLKIAAIEYKSFWTGDIKEPLLVTAKGQTNLATPLLNAIEYNPDLIVIISDAWDNDPPNGAAEVLRVYRTKLAPKKSIAHRVADLFEIAHFNPVFDTDNYNLRSISPLIPTLGLRDAEDLPTVLNFARFAEGSVNLKELEEYLAGRVEQMLSKDTSSGFISENKTQI